jgi:hypothetical protein
MAKQSSAQCKPLDFFVASAPRNDGPPAFVIAGLNPAKDSYDQHYTLLSTAIHAQWAGIREANFSQCVNPLHRYHRIPSLPRLSQENLIPEIAKLINQMLDDINHLYPQFKSRLRAHRIVEEQDASDPSEVSQKQPLRDENARAPNPSDC